MRQCGAAIAEFLLVVQGEFAQQALTLRREFDEDFATVDFTTRAVYHPGLLEAIDEFDGAVMLQLHAVG